MSAEDLGQSSKISLKGYLYYVPTRWREQPVQGPWGLKAL